MIKYLIYFENANGKKFRMELEAFNAEHAISRFKKTQFIHCQITEVIKDKVEKVRPRPVNDSPFGKAANIEDLFGFFTFKK